MRIMCVIEVNVSRFDKHDSGIVSRNIVVITYNWFILFSKILVLCASYPSSLRPNVKQFSQ